MAVQNTNKASSFVWGDTTVASKEDTSKSARIQVVSLIEKKTGSQRPACFSRLNQRLLNKA
jgi:hypothetical protein